MQSVWTPPWRWTVPIAWALSRSWGLLSRRVPGPVGGLLAVPFTLLMLTAVATARSAHTLAAVDRHAALLAIPYRPTSAHLAYQARQLAVTLMIILPVAVAAAAVSTGLILLDALVLDGGPLTTIFTTLLLVTVGIALVDGLGTFAGVTRFHGLGKILGRNYPDRTVTVLGTFGAWPRHRGHGTTLLTACAAELAARPRWDVIAVGALSDELADLYRRHGLTPLPDDTPGTPHNLLVAEFHPGPHAHQPTRPRRQPS